MDATLGRAARGGSITQRTQNNSAGQKKDTGLHFVRPAAWHPDAPPHDMSRAGADSRRRSPLDTGHSGVPRRRPPDPTHAVHAAALLGVTAAENRGVHAAALLPVTASHAPLTTVAQPPKSGHGASVPDAHGKHVQVVVRIREHENPALQSELFPSLTRNTITMKTSYAMDLSAYRFHRVLTAADPDDAPYEAVRPVMMDAVCGVNGAILVSAVACGRRHARRSRDAIAWCMQAYGQSGAGKTHMMIGSHADGSGRCVGPAVLCM